MSKAKMMYAFDHIPTGMTTGGGNVGTYSDFPFTFTGANGSSAGTVSDSGGTWLGFSPVGAAGNFWTGTWKLPVSVFDYTKPHSYVGFRFKPATANRIANPLVLYDNTTTRQAILVAVGDQTWNQNQEYYVEVLIDRTNKQRTVWVDGTMVVNAASYGSYASVSTDQLGFCEPVATGSSTTATYQYKDIYVMDDPGDGSVSRLGAIIAKPITLASASGTGWLANNATLTGTASSSSTAKFGNSSLTMGATTSSACSIPNGSNVKCLSGDFTIECWCSSSNNSQIGVLFGKDSGAAPYAHLTYSAGTWGLYCDAPGAGTTLSANSGVAASTWMHIAVVKYQGTWYFYQNGVLLGSAASATTFGNNSLPFMIGNYGALSNQWQGNIDEFRISNIARYTAAFTPSASAFTVDANTLLLMHFDTFLGGSTPDAVGSLLTPLNTAVNTGSPSLPNLISATDGTALASTFATTIDAGAAVQGVLLLASGERNAGTGTMLRSTLSDQATPPNQTTLNALQFPTTSFQYGRTLGFAPNAPDGSTWTSGKIAALSMSSVASAT